MTDVRATPWVLWLLVMTLGSAFALSSIPIQTELPLLLPSTGSLSQQLFVDQLQSGPSSRILLLGIQGAPSPLLAEASKKLAAAMRNDNQFLHVYNGEGQNLGSDQELLYQYRYLLSPKISPERFTTDRLRQSLEHRLQDLSNPLPAFFKKRIPEDPTGEFQNILSRWKSKNAMKVVHGVWFSTDEDLALLFAETATSGFDLDGQEAIQVFLTTTMKDIRTTLSSHSSPAALELVRSGPSVFAVQARSVIQQDARWLSTLGGGFVIALLLVTYRSFTILFLSLVPLLTGLLVAGITVYLVFGFIHGMTLAFGATLIGVAIDYPLHACAHLKSHESPKTAIQQVWPTIRLGATTTAIGYGAMLFSGFPGLSQLGLFAISGLLTAAAATRWILPTLAPGKVKPPLPWATWLPLQPGDSKLMLLVPISMILSFMYLSWSDRPFWEVDIANLSPVPQTLRDRDAWLRKELGAPAVRDMMVVIAPDDQQVLEQSETLKTTLDQLVSQKHLSGYEMAADYLPSMKAQISRQQALPDENSLKRHLIEAQQDLPFKQGLFEPFIESITQAKNLRPLDFQALQPTPLGTKIQSLLYPHQEQWVGTILLRDVNDRQALQQALQTGSLSSVHYLDLKTESNSMVTTYREEVTRYLLMGIGFLILILCLGLQSFSKVATVLLPIAGSIMLDLGILHALGERLSLFHLASLLLVFGIGLDYTLFYQRPHHTTTERQQTISAIFVCSLTTITIFGLLACSETPVLHGIGLTAFLGALLCFVFAAICSPAQKECPA